MKLFEYLTKQFQGKEISVYRAQHYVASRRAPNPYVYRYYLKSPKDSWEFNCREQAITPMVAKIYALDQDHTDNMHYLTIIVDIDGEQHKLHDACIPIKSFDFSI